MTVYSKAISLLIKLNKLTSTEEITWDAESPPKSLIHGTDDHIPLFMACEYKNQKIALYERKFRSFSIEFEEMYWDKEIVLAILDAHNRVLWEYSESSSALHDLFENVRRKVANVEGLLSDLLNDERET